MTVDGRVEIIRHALTLNKLIVTWFLTQTTNTHTHAIAVVYVKRAIENSEKWRKNILHNVMLWTNAYNDNVIQRLHVDEMCYVWVLVHIESAVTGVITLYIKINGKKYALLFQIRNYIASLCRTTFDNFCFFIVSHFHFGLFAFRPTRVIWRNDHFIHIGSAM